ncbi:protein LURP-one-related 8-like [Miscanthus floridulus]|uniref:protein LURP-one-related 8-like n=1 Tax=Miscanthus floridulus TaxID=154761 RepID=UPI003457BA54
MWAAKNQRDGQLSPRAGEVPRAEKMVTCDRRLLHAAAGRPSGIINSPRLSPQLLFTSMQARPKQRRTPERSRETNRGGIMAKVHPNAVSPPEPGGATGGPALAAAEGDEPPTVLTVWRKSLLLNCDGFTVFDARGDLAFRVDCYAGWSRRAADVVLMDARGKPLLTVRRKTRLGLAERCWVIYDGDADADADADKRATPLLSVRRHAAGRLLGATSASKTLARVATPGAVASAASAYVVEGSYGRRACTVRDAARGGAVVAEVQRKEAVGDDVFRLVVAGPRLGAPLAMALVIALDDMFRGSGTGAGGWSARSLLHRTLSV